MVNWMEILLNNLIGLLITLIVALLSFFFGTKWQMRRVIQEVIRSLYESDKIIIEKSFNQLLGELEEKKVFTKEKKKEAIAISKKLSTRIMEEDYRKDYRRALLELLGESYYKKILSNDNKMKMWGINKFQSKGHS